MNPLLGWNGRGWSLTKRGSDRVAFRMLGAWEDVRRKAVRLRQTGAVTVVGNERAMTIAEVRGDHGTYTVVLWRTDPTNRKIVTWSCTCPWGYWAFRRQYQYRGRVCSHALATFWEARSLDYGDTPEMNEMDRMYVPETVSG